MNQSYELHAFAGDEDGVIADNPEVETVSLRDVNAARSRAGRLAKRIRGPVDLAYSGKQPWNERYITTAIPSEFHAMGYRFERLT